MSDTTTVHADRNTGILHLVFGDKGREALLTILLAFSVLVNIWLIYQYRDFRTQEWLVDNNLTFFKTNEYADLKAKVLAQESLINSYGLQQSCRRDR
jgi:hypothetical protein